jgi:hypothetical protein
MLLDNKKLNRLIVFASPTGLRMLSEATAWYADGTFRTSAKFFVQLYVIMAYFVEKPYDEGVDQVHVKRCLPAAWALSTRRRTKDYVTLCTTLKDEAFKLGLYLDPRYIFTDYELASINAFRVNFLNA